MTTAPTTAPERTNTSLSRALTLVHTHRADLRTDLTERLGLTRTATGLVLRELQTLSLIRSAAVQRSDGGSSSTGRPSHAVEIHPDAPVVLAVQVQAETVLVAEARLGGTLGRIDEFALPAPATPESVLGLLAQVLSERLTTAVRLPFGIGLALPSAVGSDGTALAAHHLAWPHAVPVRQMLGDLLTASGHGDVRMSIGNDANLAALAESRHGAGQGAGQMLYVMTGQVGVGGGLVVDGRLHLGSAGYALEIGHTPVPPGDRLCRCGNRGCLEVEADPAALLAAAEIVTNEPTLLAARSVIAHRRDNPSSGSAVELITRRLAAGLASMVNVLNPDRIVLGGLYADLLAAEESELRAGITRHSFLDQAAQVELRAAGLGASALTGAAELAFQPLLDDPRLLV